MILCFQIVDLDLNKINFPFGNFSPILRSNMAKLAKIGILQNPLKSGGFMLISQKLHPLLGLKCAL